MPWTLTDIWRHPVKSHGAERLDAVQMTAGQALPWDRVWAVAHEAAKLSDGWASCTNFSRGAKAPGLMAIRARFDEATGRLHLSHPDLEDLDINPDTDGAALVAWAGGLVPENRSQSTHVVRVDGVPMTDVPYPWVSVLNRASNRALSQKMGLELDQRRWRGNLWLDGLAPWEEFDLVDQTIRIGDSVTLRVKEPITRCLGTTADPDTGKRNADTLGALESGWGHQDFGVYAEVLEGGPLSTGDSAHLLR